MYLPQNTPARTQQEAPASIPRWPGRNNLSGRASEVKATRPRGAGAGTGNIHHDGTRVGHRFTLPRRHSPHHHQQGADQSATARGIRCTQHRAVVQWSRFPPVPREFFQSRGGKT
jgi:hypothetical protein